MSHELTRKNLRWGTVGKNPDLNNLHYTWVRIKDLSNPHIGNIIRTQDHIGSHLRNIFRIELFFRLANNIYIEEVEKYAGD